MLKRKVELNYRRGYTHSSCEDCDHLVRDWPVHAIGGGLLREEDRCKVIGLQSGRMYRVGRKNICDRYDNTESLARIKGEVVA